MAETYNYATIEIAHRLNVNKPINHEVIVLDKVIRTGIEHKFNHSEMQIIYRDAENKPQLGKYDLKDYRFKIIKLGDCQLEL